ncbi:hypothetical protein [Yersinia ruckeri]|uniref:hypothetical protein n=1 Tax=Yersinia ruckeri TaxID=29486 RepID=UPI0008FD0924|nr:hypothetical protein [Yersinia ruckeri]ARZ01842.1 hypothetical protein QMA0440_02520 [Yersinia ruckeri]MCK8571324.1 hypothetical protein [Yersinia ruckeri]MCK8577673.1 hypothetical protein [Yersinia ruckeri]MCK8581452.1 hypothetical protein [Yersinia ruckeri]MCW6523058.1 hypothetical protein [Yersinia ruckeri]
MDITKLREAFEAWLTSEYDWGAGTLDKAHFQGDDKTGHYIGGEFLCDGSSCGEALFWAWRGWQARHSSFEVDIKLPELFEDDRHAVTDAIRAAGIRIKGESE